MPEFTILNSILDNMESTGSTYREFTISINQEFVDEINKNNDKNYALKEIERLADKCLAHEWIEYGALGSKYGCLRITPKGVGAARSRRRAEELQSSISPLKKISDYIEDRKGLFIVLGFILALATLGLKIFGD